MIIDKSNILPKDGHEWKYGRFYWSPKECKNCGIKIEYNFLDKMWNLHYSELNLFPEGKIIPCNMVKMIKALN